MQRRSGNRFIVQK